jgi:hypothetical protein
MANLTPQSTSVIGTSLTLSPATVTVGDTVPVNSKVILRNGSGSSINVTIVTPGNDQYGIARPDVVTAVANGAMYAFGGPFPADLADPANSYLVTLICSAVTSVTLSVMTED